jgi:hypothetical protein
LNLAVLVAISPPVAVACTCVNTPDPKHDLKSSTMAFKGTVLKSEPLPQHPKMRGRGRYAVTFEVVEYWKGNPGPKVTLHDVDPGTDCKGAGYEVGHSYLLFAYETKSTGVQMDPDYFWFGWTDVLPEGTSMLVPTVACTTGGDLANPVIRKYARRLGRGRAPRRSE